MGDTPRRPWRPLLLAGLTLVLTFAAGAAAGAALERARAPEPGAAHAPRAPGRPPIFAADGPLGARLGLTDTQRDSIQAILERDRVQADAIYREFRPRLRARFDSTTAAVDEVLTPEQREEWARLRTERRRGWRDEGRDEGARERGRRPDRRRPPEGAPRMQLPGA